MAGSKPGIFYAILSLFFGLALSQSCWKKTPCSGPSDTAFPGQWESNIYAPASRTVTPKSIVTSNHEQSPFSGSATLSGNGSQLTFDFGIEVGGLVSLKYSATGAGAIGLAFTESKNWIGEWSDSSNGGFKGPDGAIYANFSGAGEGSYTMPDRSLRGGFRYLTLFLVSNKTTTVHISNISLEIGFQPTWSNLRAYQGYFYSNDELLNRIWYAGAYTLQTNSVPINTGRQVPFVVKGWANNGTLGTSGDSVIVDGAKRDRAVWPGDMGIAAGSSFVSIGDLSSIKNALQTMYDNQDSTTGAFPEAGPPLLQKGSDTYHMWSMIGTYNYLLYSNDTSFLLQNWSKYLKAMNFIYGKVGSSGLLNVTGIRDWARWQQGFNNSEANMILYHTLLTGADLSTYAGDTTGLNATWTTRASNLKTAINKYCYDNPYGAFKDNATATTLHPQDANSMAILFTVVDSPAKAQTISKNLLKNWTPIGAVTPELPGNISPFISGFEIAAHFSIGQTDRALDLIRRCWGWYANNPNGTQSTVIEGYLQNGTFGYRSSRGYAYDASYVSHSHGWSAGPTASLTTYVLGLSILSPAGATWKVAPQFGDLKSAEGGFTTSLGKYQVSWKLVGGGYTLEYDAPHGTTGQVYLPVLTQGQFPTITIDGDRVPASMKPQIEGSAVVLNSQGGKHAIVVK